MLHGQSPKPEGALVLSGQKRRRWQFPRSFGCLPSLRGSIESCWLISCPHHSTNRDLSIGRRRASLRIYAIRLASEPLVRLIVSDLQARNSHSLSSLATTISRRLIETIISGTPGHVPRTGAQQRRHYSTAMTISKSRVCESAGLAGSSPLAER
jgi:hypothetical protein